MLFYFTSSEVLVALIKYAKNVSCNFIQRITIKSTVIFIESISVTLKSVGADVNVSIKLTIFCHQEVFSLSLACLLFGFHFGFSNHSHSSFVVQSRLCRHAQYNARTNVIMWYFTKGAHQSGVYNFRFQYLTHVIACICISLALVLKSNCDLTFRFDDT